MAQEIQSVNKKLTKIYMAAKIDVPHDVVLANQQALERCKSLQESSDFRWFSSLLANKAEIIINNLALSPLQTDTLTPNEVTALRGQLGLLLDIVSRDGECHLLSEIAASANLLQAPE